MTKHREPANKSEAYELRVMAENDANLYRQCLIPIYRNLHKKIQKRIYRHELAVKLMRYAVDEENKKYKKEYGVSFSPATRDLVAKEMTKDFEKNYRYNLDKKTKKFLL